LADIHALNANGDRACRARPFRHARDSKDWLNDGVPLALPVAEVVLTEWYGENAPAGGTWRIAGRVVDPARCTMPSLVVVPAQDRIVPPGSARALGTALPFAETWTPTLGHIGMVVSREAPRVVWEPLRDWLLARTSVAKRARPRKRPVK